MSEEKDLEERINGLWGLRPGEKEILLKELSSSHYNNEGQNDPFIQYICNHPYGEDDED